MSSNKIIDITGNKYGYLTAVGLDTPKISKSGNRRIMWSCLCDCGNITSVYGGHLKNGHTKSCGKCGKYSNFKNLTGKKFDKLTVVKFDSWHYYPNGEKDARWLCECDCGNTIVIRGNSLKSSDWGHSCGCYNREYRINDDEMIGKIFGNLKIIKRLPSIKITSDGSRKDMWLCECKCGNIIEARGSYLRYGKTNSCGCLFKNSGYERALANYFKTNHIKFTSQKTFSDCLSDTGNPLFYDFYVNIDNNNILIELNGEQHYKPIKYFGGVSKFEGQKKRDEIKKNYAKIHNIPLITINCTNLKHSKVIIKVVEEFKKIGINI